MTGVRLQVNPLPYANALEQRSLATIDLLVIHCTELPDLATARQFGERIHYAESGTGNSGHYYIDRDGHTEQWLSPDRVAHHVRGYNPRSIGIELVNSGRYPNWLHSAHQELSEPYPQEQLSALIQLIEQLQSELSSLHWIAGHSDLDTALVAATDNPAKKVRRKLDPGPCFPWSQLLAAISLHRFQAAAPT